MLCNYRAWWLIAVLLAGLGAASCGGTVQLERIISQENQNFALTTARLSVGRDGKVYLSGSISDQCYALRLNRDGSEKSGGMVGHALRFCTANAAGVIAAVNAHLTHTLRAFNPSFKELWNNNDFLASDAAGFSAPDHVEAGASGDFYVADQYRDRIIEFKPNGNIANVYPIPRAPGNPKADIKRCEIKDFRVCEKTKAFYIQFGAFVEPDTIACVGFDGKVRWRSQDTVNFIDAYNGGGFDVDAQGNLYMMGNLSDTIMKYGPDGAALAPIKLDMGANKPVMRVVDGMGYDFITDLRVFGNEAVLRRYSTTELFQRYDLTTGKQLSVVNADVNRLTVSYPDEVWQAGQALPFTITFENGAKHTAPHWRVWARPLAGGAYQELFQQNGTLQVPVDFAGLYLVKVSPEVAPEQRGAASEYQVQATVEVRRPGSAGTANVFTPYNRIEYGRGEEIPFGVRLCCAAANLPTGFSVRLLDGGHILAEKTLPVNPDMQIGDRHYSLTLPASVTARLRPGHYQLAISAQGLTGVGQPLNIGPGLSPDCFHILAYGDYADYYPSTQNALEAPDLVQDHLESMSKQGWDLIVERPGIAPGVLDNGGLLNNLSALTERLRKDPTAVAPEKAALAATPLQCLAGYGARGIRYMPLLMNNDAGLPLSPKESTPGFDHRSQEQVLADLTKVHTILAPYAAFRGWCWSSNWWIYNNTGANAARTPEEKAAYLDAVKDAAATGAWKPVLDIVTSRRLAYAANTQELFHRTIDDLTPDRHFVNASAGPYRNVDSYPPISLRNLDEIDLQAQWEQAPPAFYAPHNVDFYTRPGTRSFAHPEVWNDNGTGDMMLTMLMSQLMRGASGIGISGLIHPWGQQVEDSRSGYNGLASVYRTFFSVIKPYGPWLTTLQPHDQVAIIADGRMFKIDEWTRVMGRQFYRVLEAYATCLSAHYPASIVFAEDVRPDTLKAYKAVILVSQTVEMEPALLAALRAAKDAGVTVLADSLCRPALVKEFDPLPCTFNHLEADQHQAGCDYSIASFLADCRVSEPALLTALRAVASPPARVADDQIWLSERSAGTGRVLFVVNNTIPTQEPGQLWRIDLALANRLPRVAPVMLPGTGETVYDLLAMQEVKPQQGVVQADLRYFPARMFVILPTPIAGISVAGAAALKAGQSFTWRATVIDANGKPIPASLPVRIRLLDVNGAVLEEQPAVVNGRDASGVLTLAVNTPAGPVTLEAMELCSGKVARLQCKVTPAGGTMEIRVANDPASGAAALPARDDLSAKPLDAASTVTSRAGSATPASAPETRFGPHIRDMVLASDGATAVMNTMNWDNNLYAIDVATGQPRWHERVGDYFTFAPIALQDGFAVQGYNFSATEGYRLFRCDGAGKVQRGFGGYDIARRAIQRFVPSMYNDHMNSFAMPVNGAWVAAGGDLGVAVWKSDGTLQWSLDQWKQTRTTPTLQGVDAWDKARLHTPLVTALDADTLLVTNGMHADAYDALSGKVRWQLVLGSAGEIRQLAVSRDGRTCALLTDYNNGAIYLVRRGAVVASFPAHGADTLALSPDGTAVAMAGNNQLQYYTETGGLQWSYAGEATMHYPRFAPDGAKLVACSALGTLTVLRTDGTVLGERDLGALAMPVWLPNGDLLAGSWEGQVCRLDGATLQERWHTLLRPAGTDTASPAAEQGAPISRITSFSNALPQPLPIGDNLLAQINPSPFIHFFAQQPGNPQNLELQNDYRMLFDGKTDAPKNPWLDWGTVAWFAEQYPCNYIEINTFVTQLHVTAVTLVEDPAHPESWLRDVYLEYWDAEKEQWVYAQHLLSDAAVHSHQLVVPIDAARFRIVLPWGCCGNVRLAEIVFHGKVLGHSNADVRAGRPRCTLFDGQSSITTAIYGNYQLTFNDAYTGKACLTVGDDKTDGAFNMAIIHPTAGYIYPDWYVPIAENPQPGEYRYLQFAWKAMSPTTTGMTLVFNCNTYTVCTGTGAAYPGTPFTKVGEKAPAKWTTVTVDLWDAFGRHPFRLGCMGFVSTGGKAGLAQVVLGRTKADLPAAAP